MRLHRYNSQDERLIGRTAVEMKELLIGKVVTIKPQGTGAARPPLVVETVHYRKGDEAVVLNEVRYRLNRIVDIADQPPTEQLEEAP